MISKLVCASLLAASVHSHAISTRDTKVNRDSGYAAPAAAAPSYSAPSTGYGAGGGGGGYAAPEATYSAPSTGYGEETGGGLDLTKLLIPLLALIGLSLLYPTFVSVSAGGRRKRSDSGLDDDVSPMARVMERVNDIYMSVVESEECMERIACEVGGLAKDFGMKNTGVFQMMDPFVGGKYKTYYKQFTNGSNCQKIKCGSFHL